MKAFIEMVKGDKDKWELNKGTEILESSRKLSIPVPFNYGFIPGTLAKDGDELDVFVVAENDELRRGAYYPVKPVGVFRCIDNGIEDDKVVALYGPLLHISMAEIIILLENYLSNYKKGFVVKDYKKYG